MIQHYISCYHKRYTMIKVQKDHDMKKIYEKDLTLQIGNNSTVHSTYKNLVKNVENLTP
jgi:hypothetical protein